MGANSAGAGFFAERSLDGTGRLHPRVRGLTRSQ